MKLISTVFLSSILVLNIFPQNNFNSFDLSNIKLNNSIMQLNKSPLRGKDRLKLKAILFSNSKNDFSNNSISKRLTNTINKKEKINDYKFKLGNGYYLINEVYQTWGDTSWINVTKYIYNFDNSKRLSETVYQIWDGTDWINSTKDSNSYDINNNLSEELIRDWNGTEWVDKNRYTYIYDDNNNQSEALWEDWTGFDWVSTGEYIYTYDENNNLLEERFQVWNNDHWDNNLWSIYTYQNNNLTSLINREWGDTSWVNVSKFMYEYDSNKNQTLSTEQSWGNSDWVNNSKYVKTYDGNNNLINMTYQSWNIDWVNNQYYKYKYDGNNNLIEQQTQDWNGSGWDNDSNSLYTYNDTLLTYQLDQTWDGANWMDFAKTYNNYDKNNNLIDNYYVTWDDTIWVNNYMNIYEYSTLTTADKNLVVIKNFILFNNYPNPFNPSTIISWESPINGVQTLKIFDVLGREVATLVNEYRAAGKYKIEFSPVSKIHNLASGIYFYQLRINSDGINMPDAEMKNSRNVFTQTKKMIYLK